MSTDIIKTMRKEDFNDTPRSIKNDPEKREIFI